MVGRILLLCLLAACAGAQTLSPEVQRRIEQQVRIVTAPPVDAQVIVGAPGPSDFPGFDSVLVTVRSREGAERSYQFLVAGDRKRMLLVRSFDLTQDPYARVMQSIDVQGRPVRGTRGAPVSIVVFDDFQCPFCAKMYITLFNVAMNQYRDRVQVVLKDFPLTDAHPWAMDAAVAANCLAAQSPDAYWTFSDYVHTHQQEMTQKWQSSRDAFLTLALDNAASRGVNAAKLRSCVADHNTGAIESSRAEGRKLGIEGTPVMFINGAMYEGALSETELRAALDRALADASATAKQATAKQASK